MHRTNKHSVEYWGNDEECIILYFIWAVVAVLASMVCAVLFCRDGTAKPPSPCPLPQPGVLCQSTDAHVILRNVNGGILTVNVNGKVYIAEPDSSDDEDDFDEACLTAQI